MKNNIGRAKSWKFQLEDYEQDEYEKIKSSVDDANVDWAVINKFNSALIGFITFKEKTRITTAFGFKRDGFIYQSTGGKGTSPTKQKRCDVLSIKEKGEQLYSKNATFKEAKEVKVLDDDKLYDWQEEIISVIEKEPDDRTIHWYWSNSGNVGKSTFQKYLCIKYGAIVLGGKSNDCKHAIVEYEKANGDKPEIIVCNIPRSFDAQYISYQAFEEIKDMCFYSGKYEGGMIVGNCPHLFIFANIEPNIEKMSKDRWNIINLDPPTLDQPTLDHWTIGPKDQLGPKDQHTDTPTQRHNDTPTQNIIYPMDETDSD